MNVRPLLLLLLAAALPALAAAPATLSRVAELRAQPYGDAGLTASWPAGSKVEIVERKGGWYRISSPALGSGWTRMSNVRLAPGAGPAGAVAMAGTGRASATGAVGTTGIRGLSETDIANAQPNFAALSQLARYSTTPADVNAHAARLGLKSQAVALFPEDQP